MEEAFDINRQSLRSIRNYQYAKTILQTRKVLLDFFVSDKSSVFW